MNQGICSNAIVINKNNEILLVKRSLDDPAFPGNWELPGGEIEYGETIQESLQRELQEECGLSIEVRQPLTVNYFYIEKIQYFEFTFFCKNIKDSYEVVLSNEHSEYIWINFNELDKLELSEYIKKTLSDAHKTLENYI